MFHERVIDGVEIHRNCLEGMVCPRCGHTDSFRIEARTMMTLRDDGTDDYGDSNWDSEDYCRCDECDLEGYISEFRTDFEFPEDIPAFVDHVNEIRRKFKETQNGDGENCVPHRRNQADEWG